MLKALSSPTARFVQGVATTCAAPDAAHLDLLCQTAPRPHPDPDIGIFLHGKGRTDAEVRVAFRCDFDPERPQDWPEIACLCPPVAGEMFSVPLHRFHKWFENHASTDTNGDVEGERDDTEASQAKRTAATKSDDLTDIYLLALAVKHGGRFVTFDAGVDASLIPGGPAAYHVIPAIVKFLRPCPPSSRPISPSPDSEQSFGKKRKANNGRTTLRLDSPRLRPSGFSVY